MVGSWQSRFLLLAFVVSVPILAQTSAMDPALLAKAGAGDSEAQVAVGELYVHLAASEPDTDQAATDYQQAVGWYRKAADQANIAAEIHLADLFRDGQGVLRDRTQAAAWYRKAADQGDTGAQGTLGVLYSYGQGVPQDDAEAYFWFDLAAAVDGPNQQKYVANRQAVGMRITAEELAQEHARMKKWKAAHPNPAPK
jgi:TPR repeat protein